MYSHKEKESLLKESLVHYTMTRKTDMTTPQTKSMYIC